MLCYAVAVSGQQPCFPNSLTALQCLRRIETSVRVRCRGPKQRCICLHQNSRHCVSESRRNATKGKRCLAFPDNRVPLLTHREVEL